MATPLPISSSSSASDAASTLLQSLTTKIERVQQAIQENTTVIHDKEKQLRQIQNDIEKLDTEENRINEYLNTLGDPDWSRLCSVTPPETLFTIQIISPIPNPSSYAVPSSSPSVMTVGLSDTKHPLNGKVCTVNSIGSARCLSDYLRSNNFLPPSNENELLEIFHVANDLQLDDLSTLIKEFLLSNLQQ